MSARAGIVAGLVLGGALLVRCGGSTETQSHVCPASPVNPPAAPTLLVLTPVSPTRIDLAWTDNASDETGFRVERSGDGLGYLEIALVPADSVVHSDPALSP